MYQFPCSIVDHMVMIAVVRYVLLVRPTLSHIHPESTTNSLYKQYIVSMFQQYIFTRSPQSVYSLA